MLEIFNSNLSDVINNVAVIGGTLIMTVKVAQIIKDFKRVPMKETINELKWFGMGLAVVAGVPLMVDMIVDAIGVHFF